MNAVGRPRRHSPTVREMLAAQGQLFLNENLLRKVCSSYTHFPSPELPLWNPQEIICFKTFLDCNPRWLETREGGCTAIHSLIQQITQWTSTVLYWSQPITNHCCDWTSPYGSYYGCKTPFSNSYREILKRYRFIIYKSWNLHSTPVAPQRGSARE